MAYVDYIHCAECDCKLIYDASALISDRLEVHWGNPDADDYTVKLFCPDCQQRKDERIAALEAERDAQPWYKCYVAACRQIGEMKRVIVGLEAALKEQNTSDLNHNGR